MNKTRRKTIQALFGFLFIVAWFPIDAEAQGKPDGIEIKGKVVDETNNPLDGATVLIKGRNKGTKTDKDGAFTLQVTSTDVLMISFLNYEPQEVSVDGRQALNIKLVPVNKGLDEVVVIGYGTVAKRDLTGAVGSVDMIDFMKAPVRSFDEALQGKISGVQVVMGDGQPGNTANIVIRGNNSITQGNSPLYVIDGFPMDGNDNSSINPSDIESIEVLKDASATAIYGARGANGVIIVTTKRGKEGAPKVAYEGYYALQKDYNRIPVMSPYEFVRLQNELDPKIADIYLGAIGKTLEDYRDTKGIDWSDMVLQVAPQYNSNLSILGGTKATKYSISLSNLNQDGVIRNSGFDRWQGRVTMDHEISKRVKIGVNVNYSDHQTHGFPVNSGGGSSSFMWSVWAYRPVVGDPNLDLINMTEDPEIGSGPARTNPYLQVENELFESRTKSLMANANVSIEVFKGLRFRSTLGVSDIGVGNSEFHNSKTRPGSPIPGNTMGVNGQRRFSSNTTFTNENTLTYSSTFGLNRLTALAGYTYQKNKTNSFAARGSQVPNESLGLDGLDEAKGYTITSATSSGWGLQSFLARAIYSYDAKYDLTLSMRADGSSRFSKSNRWSDFYSGAIAWRISEEKFMENLTWISDAKFRVSYGTTGNNNVGNFSYMPQIKVTGGDSRYDYSFGNQAPDLGAVIYSIGNENLKWETTTQFNAGLDWYMFKNRMNLTVDYYKKVTSDLLINADLPAHKGYPKAFKNIGEVQNQGWELNINTENVQTQNFSWSSNFNISFNRNRVNALTEGQQTLVTIIDGSFPASGYIAKVGYPIGMFYGAVYDGLYQYDDFIKASDGTYILNPNLPSQSTLANRNAVIPGYAKYKDLNNDQVINSDDFTIIGDPNPDFIGGFTNNIRYRNFDLNLFFQFSYGNEMLNANRMTLEEGRHINTNQYASLANRWTVENPDGDVPRIRSSNNTNWLSSRVVEDASYIKLKNIALGYTIPRLSISQLYINNLRIYGVVQNIYTWTKYSGSDPEVSTRHSALTPAYDSSSYPACRMFTFGASLTF